MIVCVGKEMILPGFDNALSDKEIGKQYSVELSPKEAFGEFIAPHIESLVREAIVAKA